MNGLMMLEDVLAAIEAGEDSREKLVSKLRHAIEIIEQDINFENYETCDKCGK